MKKIIIEVEIPDEWEETFRRHIDILLHRIQVDEEWEEKQ